MGDLMRQGGGRVAAGITYAPLFDREDGFVNAHANVRDITKFREAEEVKSTFISIISHVSRRRSRSSATPRSCAAA
jgi:hypothetical protein